jgi:hypothetical protein
MPDSDKKNGGKPNNIVTNVIGELTQIGLKNPLSSAIGLLTLLIILALFISNTLGNVQQTIILSLVLLFMSALTIGALQFAAGLRASQIREIFQLPIRALVWVATSFASLIPVATTSGRRRSSDRQRE